VTTSTAGTVLFVDDIPDVVSTLARMVGDQPYQVLTAGSSDEALDVLSRREIAVVVADDHMPGMSGSEMLAQVRRKYPHTVRVLLTGIPSVEQAIGAINDGDVFHFLQKPCEREKLIEVIARAFDFRAKAVASQRLLQVAQEQVSLVAALSSPGHPKPLKRARTPSDQDLKAMKTISRREREVLDHLVEGRRITDIADALFISPHTVRNHLKSLFKKLGVPHPDRVGGALLRAVAVAPLAQN